MNDRVRAVYRFETAAEPGRVAEMIAGEQSTGTFTKLPGEERAAGCAARVERLEILRTIDQGSLQVHGRSPKNVTEAVMELSWSGDNFETALPSLMTTVAGNLFEMRELTGLRLQELHLPDEWATAYKGPQFGVAGSRVLAGVQTGPIIGTIVKPSVGLGPEDTAAAVAELCTAGLDFIKDDELQGNGRHCPFDERVKAVMRVVNDHADRTGKKVMYAFNISGEIDEMRRRHDLVVADGGTCVMLSVNSVGLSATHHITTHAAVPVHGHRNGWGYLSRHPALGFDFAAWQVFWRLAGVDHLHVSGLGNKFSEDDETVAVAARACLAPIFSAGRPGYEVMPVFASGQWAKQAFETYAALGSSDLIYACGGGIMAHPGGVAAGVESIREAWVAAEQGSTLEETVQRSAAVKQAVEAFGR